MAGNSSHLSPGLVFNCSALPAGSSLLRSSAALFSNAFHKYHFAKTTAQSLLVPDITHHYLTDMEKQALFHTLGSLNFLNLTPGSPVSPLFTGFNQANCPPGFWVCCQGGEIRSATRDHVGGPQKP